VIDGILSVRKKRDLVLKSGTRFVEKNQIPLHLKQTILIKSDRPAITSKTAFTSKIYPIISDSYFCGF
jgi:hypothetical protein